MPPENTQLDDFEVIASEILRLHEKLKSGLLDENDRDDFLYSLPHPRGWGILPIGRKAAQHFTSLAERAIQSDPVLRNRCATATVRDAIKNRYLEYVFKQKREMSASLADRIVGRACKYVRDQKLETNTYFYPCVLADQREPQTFDVGPVHFQPTSTFFNDNEDAISAYTENASKIFLDGEREIILGNRPRIFKQKRGAWPFIEIQRSSKMFEDALRDYMKSYDWVASIRMQNFDRDTGERFAKVCIQMALNVLRLFIGASHSERFRLGGGYRLEKRTANFRLDDDGIASISLSSKSESAPLGDQWLSKLFTKDGQHWISLAGSLINYIQSGHDIPMLYQKLIDAIWWYGEGVSEPLFHAKVLRYANALEALLAPSPNDIASQLAARTAFLTAPDYCDGFSATWRNVKEFYDARSSLSHGRLSPTSAMVERYAWLGEKIVRETLIESLEWTLYLGRKNINMNAAEIKKHYITTLPYLAYKNRICQSR